MSFFYGKNGLASQFPEEFKGEVPERAIVLVATAVCDGIVLKSQDLTPALQLECCLHEWKEGYMKARPFSAALYSRTYKTIINLIKKLKTNAYHEHKFQVCREEWAQRGRYVFISALQVSHTDRCQTATSNQRMMTSKIMLDTK